MESTVAEIVRASGFYPPDITADHSARDIELIYETRVLELKVERISCRRASAKSGATWTLIINVNLGNDIEWAAYEERPLAELTKMHLVRCLQTRVGITGSQRLE